MFFDRKSPRMKHFDYRFPTMYFVTICSHEKKCIFGEPACLNKFGQAAKEGIDQISAHYPCATVEKYVVMPNHVHMLILLTGENIPSLSVIIGSYKSSVSKKIHEWDLSVDVWQRSFHDHIVRNDESYKHIWQYIDENPYHWNEYRFFMSTL